MQLKLSTYFNNYFVNIREDVTKQLDPLDFSSLNTFITRIAPIMDYVNISWEVVKDKPMKATNLKKATSPDNVSPRDLWQIGDSTTHSPLLINKSLSNSTFPSNWNLSNVNPIFKKSSPTYVKNFRPLCPPSLFLERSQKMLFEITP